VAVLLLVLKENKNVEMKGSFKAEGSYRMSNSEELEFLNDAIYFSRGGQEFEWQIAKQLDITKAQDRMKEMLGNGDIPDGIDERLLGYLEDLDEIEAEKMIEGLQQLVIKIDQNKVIKNANYLE
jgi:hypothetical protein